MHVTPAALLFTFLFAVAALTVVQVSIFDEDAPRALLISAVMAAGGCAYVWVRHRHRA